MSDIEEDLNSSSIKEESNQYYEDLQSSSSQIQENNGNKIADKKQEDLDEKQSKSSQLQQSLQDEDNSQYEQDFEDENGYDEIDKLKKDKQKQIEQLKPTQSQIKQLSQSKLSDQQEQENQPQRLQESFKSSINEEQLKKQQLSFIGNLNRYVNEQQNESKSLSKTQDSLAHTDPQTNQKKIKNEKSKPPIPTKQNFIKDYIEENPKIKNDIEQVPNDEEIEEIIRKNQQDFLQMIKKNSQKNSPVKQKEEVSEYGSENQYYDEEEEDLQVIYETDREDSQAGKSSQNESFDNHYYSKSYGSSVYQQYSALHASQQEEDNQYYEESQMKQKEIIKNRKQTQNEYERIINQKKIELQQLQEIQKLKQQLNVNIDIDEEQMLKIAKKAKQKEKEIEEIKILQDRMRYGCKKCAESNTQKDREAYREENEHLRKVINEQEAQIKLLKVQLRKSGDKNLDNSYSSIGSISTSFQRKMEELEYDKEKLKEENSQLRNQLKHIKKSAQNQISRQQRLNNEIQKVMGSDIRKLQEKENKKPQDPNLEKQHKVLTERLAELRIDLEKMIKKYEDQKQKIKEKDEQIITLKQKVQGRHFQKQIEKINELQAVVDNFEKDKDQIREEMQLDKQLQLLFPKQMVLICNFFNICVAVEEMKRGRYSRIANIIFSKAKPFISYFKNIFYSIKDTIKFKISKNPIDHPKQQEIIRATIKAWNESPEIVARQMKSQQKELKELRLNYIEVFNEVESLRQRNELLEKDVEILRQRNNVVETRLTVDKNKLVNNVIIQLKHHAIEDEEQDYLLELKKIINTIKEGPPILISQAERDAFKKQQELEAEKERKKREREERKKQMELKKQQKLEEKRQREEKEKEEQLLLQKQKINRPFSALKQKQNVTPVQNKEPRPNSAKVNAKKETTQSITSIQLLPSHQRLKEENKINSNQQDSLNKTKDSKNFRVSTLTSKSKQSLTATNNQ
ncbi:hypothetical protein TTHERM_00471370 (macronuclear) [Tetrahymena thermophila SB210]|uniref:Uncharacterized protein n=1 Tax=Tetrahymena thermophila (strain SB210) TaxID=312017 RepID=I7MGN8_TETTS|nr:hypothetical protein TTHERM_00471370 [Tetrahymena thermophila SB210]EAR85360.2 hypothetical protein TTHERM_00471370 [Tetrahymena thermophila SB210]|eukprot:XP_001033023.2 hypothetical protein TTHERM_00471370 [Tetrahymena thermophila SB210]